MKYQFKAVATFDFCVDKHEIKKGEQLQFSADSLDFESFHVTSGTDSFEVSDLREYHDCFQITEIKRDCLESLMQYLPEFPMFYADEGVKAGLIHMVSEHEESLCGLEDAVVDIDESGASFTFGDFMIDHDYVPFFYRVVYNKETDIIKAERCYFDERLLDTYFMETHMTSEQYQSLYRKIVNAFAESQKVQ